MLTTCMLLWLGLCFAEFAYRESQGYPYVAWQPIAAWAVPAAIGALLWH